MISIIVPVYNSERYLRKCLDSILRQDYTDYEIILVDDGSKDGSAAICDEYAGIDRRIRAIHKPNGGTATARNMGLDEAKGEYITFIDSDDYVPDNYLSALYNALINNDVDLAVANITYTPGPVMKHEEGQLNTEELLKTMLYRNGIADYPFPKLYKKELFEGLRYRVGYPGEDFDIFTALFSRVKKAAVTNQTTYYYCIRNGSISNKEFNTNVFGRIDTCKKMQEYFKDESDDVLQAMKACITDEAINLLTITPKEYVEQRNWAQNILTIYAGDVLNDDCAKMQLKRKIRLYSCSPALWKGRMLLKKIYVEMKDGDKGTK